ncbi:hypothetical protein K469DRAFT_559243 [Zopfia rhizophila CBS 207.26]|uniref:Zn(2)-C6 fungal-type domain-containing protein n=1 Tax=Zopfia rhizophila CBS 207.26 TaxID=1314779 RepID=A0A6A6EKY5_9PEZI|nr:hypothetical protein K469DRAFT_559243 [Zopfia rhizophila CBS 207.26]
MNHPQPIPLSLVAPREERRQASSKKKVVKIASSFTERAPKTKTSRRTGKMAEHKRTNAAKMRKKGTCIPLQCDDGDPCRRCINIKDTARVFRGPCTRFRMDSLSLVRHCNGRFSQSEAFFLSYSWKDRLNPPHDMEIMWHLPGSRSKLITSPIPIKYREYHPEELKGLDPTSSHWQNTAGTVRRVVQPPYAVSDTSSLVANVERYILESQPAIEAWIFDHARGNDLKLLTYAEAVRVRNEGNGLLRVALQMQCAAIVSQGYGTVWSPNIPGIRTYDYRQLGPCTYEAYNRDGPDRPLPQAIGHQMDVAILKYCGRLEKDLLKRLNETIFHKGIKPWYELYLTLFVMLSNLEYLHGGAERYIMSKRRTMLESQVDYVVRSQTEHWEYTAPLLHYLYQCILRGHVPLKMALENPEELRMQDGMLDDLGFRYFTRVATLLGENGKSLHYEGAESRGLLTARGRYPRMVSKLESSENPASKWIPQLFKDMIEPAPAQRA